MSNFEFYSDPKRNNGSRYVILDLSDEDNPHLLMNEEGKVIILHDEKNEDQFDDTIETILSKHNCRYATIVDF